MTKSKSHWFRIVYFQVQDKKLKLGMEKNELQSISFDWYSIDRKLHINKKSTNVKSL